MSTQRLFAILALLISSAIWGVAPAKAASANFCVHKYQDTNGNHQLDSGEPALAGWQFTIRNAAGAVLATGTTDSSGNYCAHLVLSGGLQPYSATETAQSGWTNTDPAGSTPTKNFAYVPPLGQHTVNVAFGNQMKFSCTHGLQYRQVMHGIDDNFVLPTETPTPSLALRTSVGITTAAQIAANVFDSTATDYRFADTLSFSLVPGETVVTARVTTRMQSNGGQWNNDGFRFLQTGTAFTGFGYKPLQASTFYTFDFAGASVTPTPDYGTIPASGVPQALTMNNYLDVYLQDDTAIDFLRLEMCIRPVAPPAYDIGVQKIRDANLYIIRVTNYGLPIQPTSKIEVTELVPLGVTVTSIAGTGWTCVPTTAVGPDAIVCTYAINSTVNTNQTLPPIVVHASGQSHCPNCVRAKLYKWIPIHHQHWDLVNEPNLNNNVSCVQ